MIGLVWVEINSWKYSSERESVFPVLPAVDDVFRWWRFIVIVFCESLKRVDIFSF